MRVRIAFGAWWLGLTLAWMVWRPPGWVALAWLWRSRAVAARTERMRSV